ncbi:hypothetical protein DCS_03008 [Drechmeria coniospora]|uniref:Centromere protein Mis12 n=1 Tax=Drechmeria coniospora TaxID=98403 RepID=A0A151GXN2_DRECN|nr:hypothetical protein DCS_03008 [Drechmeria coniospora]KYK61864.1 hypothetical protein DCS_03008 [Drechmeria coniospora]ODA82677.1 hypothetical protein RJ55_01185 [Drechmeria coniospora]
MSAPAASDYELLTEHFSYPPAALIDDIINTVNVLADRALDSVERLLLSIPPQKLGFSKKGARQAAEDDASAAQEAAKREIENGTHQLETLLNASIDKNFDLFELYTMRNILNVRPDDRPFMRLAHYEGLDFASHPDRPTSESVTALRRKLQQSQRLQVALEAERTRNDALLGKLRSALGMGDGPEVKKEDGAQSAADPTPFAFLRNKGGLEEGGADRPITTTAEFALSQLQALRALSASLRTIQPDLGTAAEGEQLAEGSKSWRRERVEYIEASSRKYLERAAGLELGPHGELRDGEWQGDGRGTKADKAEVEGLERLASLLGSGKDKEGPSSAAIAGQGGDDAMDESTG